MIVVTAPTGNIGSQLLAMLAAKDAPLRVIAREPAKLPAGLDGKVEVVEGSHGDRAVLERAFDGARQLFWLVPSATPASSVEAAYVDFSRAAAALLPGGTITHVVNVSALGRGWPRYAGHVSATLEMDDMLAATGVHYAALACGSLMENILRQAATIRATGDFYYPSPADLKLPHVATRDVAALSADLLLDTGWTGTREIPMLGPEDLSFDDLAAIMSDVLAKPVRFHPMAMHDMEAMVIGNGTSPGLARAMSAMLTAKNEGMDNMVERTARDAANSPTSFRRWCETVLAPAIRG